MQWGRELSVQQPQTSAERSAPDGISTASVFPGPSGSAAVHTHLLSADTQLICMRSFTSFDLSRLKMLFIPMLIPSMLLNSH